MKKLIFTAIVLSFGAVCLGQETKDWENPQVVGINKEPYHATLT